MPDFRRGSEHIAKAIESKGKGGDFKPFLPNIYWKDDGQERFVLILNPLEEIPMVKMQKVYTSAERVEYVVARTDDAIGESKDPLEEVWGYPASDLNVCVAVELEPEYEVVKGRKRPCGFVVKTRTFDRKIRDEKGEPTDEKEEVTAPLVGVICQSPGNFFNHVSSQDANTAPIHETAALIRRVGSDKNTDYEIQLFDREELDLSDLIELIENVSYLGDDTDALLEQLDGSEDDQEAAVLIGSFLLDKWLNQLADEEYYNSIFEQVDEPARYPKKGWKGGKKAAKEKEAPARSTRRSQRRSRQEPEEPTAEAPAEEPAAEEPAEPEPAAEEKPKRSRSRSSGSRSTRAADVSKASPVRERLEALKAKAEAAKAADAA